jgi:hypothetical protein
MTLTGVANTLRTASSQRVVRLWISFACEKAAFSPCLNTVWSRSGSASGPHSRAKRTWTDRQNRLDRSKMTPSRHGPDPIKPACDLAHRETLRDAAKAFYSLIHS